MATPVLSITNVAAGAGWGAVGDELKINIAGANQSAPPVAFTVKWPGGSPTTDPVNQIVLSFNAKWNGFVITRTLSMSVTGPPLGVGPSAGPFVLSPSSSVQYRQFQVVWNSPILTVADLVAGVTLNLYGSTGGQTGTSESSADWSLYFSSMSAQAFTGADHGTTPPPVSGQRFLTTTPVAATYNLLTNQLKSPGPDIGVFINSGGTVPINAEGVTFNIPTVGGVQPATMSGLPDGNTTTDATGHANGPAIQVSPTFTGSFQMTGQTMANPNTYANSPIRYTFTVWPLPTGGPTTPVFTLTGGAGHWCVAGLPDTIPVSFTASPGYNIAVTFGSFVNIASVQWVDGSNASAAPATTQVLANGLWATNNYPPPVGPTYLRPNYSGAPNTGSFVATFTIRTPDNLTVCATIPVTINVAKTAVFLPIQNFNALQPSEA